MKRNSIKRGASTNNLGRKKQRRVTAQRSRARQFLRFAVTGSAIGALCAIVFCGYQWLDRASIRPVADVSVSGSFHLLKREQIVDVINPLIENGELSVSLTKLKQALEKNAWIDHAVVNWRWPNRLNVSVIEQVPIARWGNIGFINARGEIVKLQDTSTVAGLPLLFGDAGKEKTVMQNYQQLSQLLRMSNLRISELTADQLTNWHIVLDSGTSIELGRDQLMDKIQRFLLVYQKNLSRKFDSVASVDLRYGNGVAVAWRDPQKKSDSDKAIQLAQLNDRRSR